MFPTKSNLHIDATDSSYFGYYLYNYTGTYTPSLKTITRPAIDVDAIGGYDFGMFRLEGELGYKRAKHDHYSASGLGSVDADGRTTALSAMVNGLIDFGSDNGVNFSVGGGAGWAQTKYKFSIDDPGVPDIDGASASLKDSGFAWQLLAEARYAVSPNIDVGLKYRYFNGNKVKDSILEDDDGTLVPIDFSTRLKSHSMLASLIYNFGAPAAAAAATAAAAAASAATSGDADVPGRLGDPGDGRLPGAAAAAAAAAAGAGTRSLSGVS